MMSDDISERSSQFVVFLPFLRIDKAYTVAGIEFWPLRDREGKVAEPLKSAAEPLKRILTGYVDRHDEQFTNCVVATIPGRGWRLSDSDWATVQWAASLLFLASWTCNEYFSRFGGSYVNATHFRVVGQKFSGSVPTYIAISARRRDGHSVDGGYKHGELKFVLPVQCSIRETTEVDEGFLCALDVASKKNARTLQLLRTALPFVQLANTDDEFMTGAAEAILMGSAFEQLLHGRASAYRLTRRFGDLFEQFGSIRVADARVARPKIKIDPSPADSVIWRSWRRLYPFVQWSKHSTAIDPYLATRLKAVHLRWWLHRKWIEELYDLRSKVVHQGAHESRDWGWHLVEHLVMAAYVFPLAVKLLLVKDGHYSLTEEDSVRCRAMDKLLASTQWTQNDVVGVGDDESWAAVTARVRRDLNWERAWASVRKRYPDMFADL